jgi:hypothetical protein
MDLSVRMTSSHAPRISILFTVHSHHLICIYCSPHCSHLWRLLNVDLQLYTIHACQLSQIAILIIPWSISLAQHSQYPKAVSLLLKVLKPKEMKLIYPKATIPEEGYHRSHHLARQTILLNYKP